MEEAKRNAVRFPEYFMFRLTKKDIDFIKSQFVISSELVKSQFATSRKNNFYKGQEGGSRKLPYAFTEQGIYMLVTVLKGDIAERQSIFIENVE